MPLSLQMSSTTFHPICFFFLSETNPASLFISKMMSVLAVAPYAIGVLSFTFIYFLALPYVEYLRDPKGMFENSLATKLFN